MVSWSAWVARSLVDACLSEVAASVPLYSSVAVLSAPWYLSVVVDLLLLVAGPVCWMVAAYSLVAAVYSKVGVSVLVPRSAPALKTVAVYSSVAPSRPAPRWV